MFEEILPLNPIHFFSISLDCLYYSGPKGKPLPKRYLLPDLSELQDAEAFADIFMGWSEEGIYISVESHKPIKEVSFPDFTAGDALELFFDTRDVKTSGYNTRFCHHFYFLPEAVEIDGESTTQAAEITRFRTEDKHEWCDASRLLQIIEERRQSYSQHIFIPSDCLHGFDPLQFSRIGFTYRLHRFGGTSQEFSASSEDFSIEQQPSLWASVQFVKQEG